MTFTITKIKLAIAVAVVALLVPATALATHTFGDVPTAKYYHDAVAWAFSNGITTGTSATTFSPEDPVTRGQNVTFAHRYDTNIVQPALATLTGTAAANSAAIVGNDTDIAANAAGVAGTYTKAQVDAAVLAAMLGTATIPSGTTVTGEARWDHASVSDNEDLQFIVELPGRAPTALTSDLNVNFAPAAGSLTFDTDATCTGTSGAPTAPAGKVCLYISTSNLVDGLRGKSTVETSFQDRYFRIDARTNDGTAPGNDMYLDITWAYTAP